LGLLGYFGILIFVFHFHVGGTGSRAAMSNALLTCFLVKLIRDGAYFAPEQFFYAFIYMLNHGRYKSEARSLVLPQQS
jgi:hypothetical protein